jgi:hypothetical protein
MQSIDMSLTKSREDAAASDGSFTFKAIVKL